jgi:drug/metabolite transporter (DMT)-like permease
MAVADYLIYGQKLKWFHLIGTISIVVCTVMLSLANILDPKKADNTHPEVIAVPKKGPLPSWIPVVFGVLTPVFFTTNGILTKHLTGTRKEGEPALTEKEKMKLFEPSNIAFSAYIVVNIVILIAAIPYWVLVHFSLKLYLLGLVGAIVNTLGLTAVQIALSCGPAGPVSALTTVSNLALVVIEAIKHKAVPRPLEFIGLFTGMIGALIFVIPDVFRVIFCFCCLDWLAEPEE